MMDHIFKTLRVCSNHSFQSLSNHSKLSKNTLLKAEQGLFNSPPPALIDYWLANKPRNFSELSEGQLLSGHELYQLKQRQLHMRYFGPNLLTDTQAPVHPFKQLTAKAGADGPRQVCKDLCLPPDTIDYWNKKWRRQKSIPKLFAQVLHIIGYSSKEVVELHIDYEIWRERMLNNERVLCE